MGRVCAPSVGMQPCRHHHCVRGKEGVIALDARAAACFRGRCVFVLAVAFAVVSSLAVSSRGVAMDLSRPPPCRRCFLAPLLLPACHLAPSAAGGKGGEEGERERDGEREGGREEDDQARGRAHMRVRLRAPKLFGYESRHRSFRRGRRTGGRVRVWGV